MPTATQLIDLVCTDTGLNPLVGSGDREVVLARMNEAYERLIFEAGSYKKTTEETITSGTPDVTIGPSGTFDIAISDLISFDHIVLQESGSDSGVLLEPVQKSYLLSLRQASTTASGYPFIYSYEYPILSIYPTPGSSTGQDSTLTIHYTAMPPVLIEDTEIPGDGEEITPSGIPPVFHRLLLARLTTIIILEGFDGRADEAAYHRALYNDDLYKLKTWTIRSQGVNGPYQRSSTRTNRWFSGSTDLGI